MCSRNFSRNVRTARLAAAALLSLTAVPAWSQVCTDFDPPAAGSPWPCCGATFMYDGLTFRTAEFYFVDGTPTAGGFASAVNACNGAGGHSLNLNNVNVGVRLLDVHVDRAKRVRFWYRDQGGNVNLSVNGQLEYAFDDFNMIPPNQFHPVGVHYTHTGAFVGGAWEGEVIVTALPGLCIDQFSVGGQEFCLDDLCVLPCTCEGDYNGDGRVDFDDMVTLLAAYGTSAEADHDHDGDTDFDDMVEFLAHYGEICL